jgi:hypothetical protein
MEPHLQWSEVPIENDVVDVNRRLSLRTRRARAGLPAWRLSPESWSAVTGVCELRRGGAGDRREDRSATGVPQHQQTDGDGTRESASERPTEYLPIAYDTHDGSFSVQIGSTRHGGASSTPVNLARIGTVVGENRKRRSVVSEALRRWVFPAIDSVQDCPSQP